MARNHFLPTAAIVIAILSMGVSLYLFATAPQNAYIDIPKVYEAFLLKKELAAKFENTRNARQQVLDSLKLKLQVLKHHIDDPGSENEQKEYQQILQEYYSQEERFAQDNQTQSNQYNDQVITQLNQYVADFGEKNNYDIIFGANSDGSIMYAKNVHDISEDIISYINMRYEGGAQ